MHLIDDPLDVAIIGGGPGGLAAALGLRAASGGTLTVKVFDRARVHRQMGACISLASNGLTALAALNDRARDAVLAAGISLNGVERYDECGKLITRRDLHSETAVAASGTRRPTPTAIRWFALQQALVQQLSAGMLALDHRFVGMQADDDMVTLRFDHQPEVRARLVIGADGNASAVREALFPGSLAYTGVSVWRTVTPRPADWAETGWLRSYEGDRKIAVTRSMGDYLTVSALARWPEERLGEFHRTAYYGDAEAAANPGIDKLARFDEVFADFPEKVTALLHRSDPAGMLEHGIFYRSQGMPWGLGRVTTLGDAAHVMPPNLGQGTSLALEDAWQLAMSIGQGGVNAAALRAYEAARMPRVARIAEVVMRTKMDFYHEGDRAASPMAFNPANAAVTEFIADVEFARLGARPAA